MVNSQQSKDILIKGGSFSSKQEQRHYQIANIPEVFDRSEQLNNINETVLAN
jgi:hypothetical protein